MKKKIILALLSGIYLPLSKANELSVPTIYINASLKDSVNYNLPKTSPFNLDVLLRAGLQANTVGPDNGNVKANLDEVRILMGGEHNERLSYKVRFRLNRSFAPKSQDNGSAALDFAFLKYKFGKENKWAITVGKQSAAVGSYEFANNPIYEYKFSDYVDNILNLFVVGGMLSYEVDTNHSLDFQVYNTSNHSFNKILLDHGLSAGGFEASKAPLGAYFTWNGAFADKRFTTKLSYNISQFAKQQTNHAISLANKFKTNRQALYLDLQYSYYAVDHVMIGSSIINDFYGRIGADKTFAKDISYNKYPTRWAPSRT